MVPGLTALIGWIVTTLLVALIVFKGVRRKWDFFNYNTVFLAGVMQFYSFSFVLFWMMTDLKGFENVSPTDAAWNAVAMLVPVFLACYFLFYWLSGLWKWPEKLIPKVDLPVTYSGMVLVIGIMLLGMVMTTLAGFSSFGEMFIIMVRPAISAFAVGLCVALVIKQPRNLVFWMLLGGIFLFGLVMSTTFQTGRRDSLGIFLAAVWMAYWGWMRYQRMGKQVGLLLAGGFISLTFLFAYTNMRGSVRVEDANLQTRFTQLQDIATGKVNPFSAEQVLPVILQDTAIYTAYIMDTYPDVHELVPFNGPVFFFSNPIPRILWEDKPVALGIQVQKHLHAMGNLGVGIIGHGWAEGMFIGVLIYAAFFGLLYRPWDQALVNRANNPFFISLAGSGLGHLLALPRGEVALFLVLWFYGIVTITFMLFVIKLFFGPFLAATAPVPFGYDDPANLRSMGVDVDDEYGDQGAPEGHVADDVPENEAYGDDEFRRRHFGAGPAEPARA